MSHYHVTAFGFSLADQSGLVVTEGGGRRDSWLMQLKSNNLSSWELKGHKHKIQLQRISVVTQVFSYKPK